MIDATAIEYGLLSRKAAERNTGTVKRRGEAEPDVCMGCPDVKDVKGRRD